VNHKRIFRLYREEKLGVRKRKAPNARLAFAPRSLRRKGLTIAGALILFTISAPMAAGFGFWRG
jgi:hypothetical protein